jgi:hypothetical protein
MKTLWASFPLLLLSTIFVACEPDVGSDKWCQEMADTPKGDWSTNDAKAFAENCIFKEYD